MNSSVFDEAFRLYYMPLYSYAFFLTHNKADSEDLVSETFIRAMLSWDEKGSLRAWMFRVLKNLFIDEIRRKKRFMTDGDDFLQTVPDQRDSNREEQEQQDSERQWLLKQIQMMRVSDQELMILTLYSGLNDAELAEHLQISPENLRVRRYRIKEKLKTIARKEQKNEGRTN